MKLKILTLLVMVSLLTNIINAQERAALIDENIAVFYPKNFVKEKQLPSLMLVNEPKEKKVLPATWVTKVKFSEAFGKTMACVEVPVNTDLYGTGEVTGSLIRNGKTIELWNTDNLEYGKYNGTRLYQSHPWVLAVRPDGTAFGVLADNTWKQEISTGNQILFSSYGPAFRVFVIEGKTPQDVLQSLSKLIGTISMPPLWSLGYQQCRWSYYPDTRVKEIADEFRNKKIPCDVIWLDIHYMNDYRIFTFSPKYFPNPSETNQYLHQKGFHSVWMIDPGVKFEKNYFVYDEGKQIDAFVKNSEGKDFVGPVWPGNCVFPDFTKEKTAAWWSSLYKNYMANGIDGVWNDMNEPSVFESSTGTMPEDNKHAGGLKWNGSSLPADTHLRYHNVFGMLMTKASREGILAANPSKRPFVLTRSNFIGGQRYAATWTGDNVPSWEHLKMSIPMSLTLGLSAQPFSGSDIGGFNGNTTPDLFSNWMAVGVFYPFARGHKAVNFTNHEPWSFGEAVENTCRIAIERRYRLLPYLYTLFHESSINGLPVMRPVFFADVKDKNLRKEEQAFMWGNDLLIVPQWAENAHLPEGKWRTIHLVEEEIKDTKYQPELKIRPGAIIPLSNIIQNTNEYLLDTLTLLVSLDKNNEAEGKLYYDAGDGFGYKNGEYSLLQFKAHIKNNEVIVEAGFTKNNYALKNKTVIVKLIGDEGVKTVTGNLNQPIRIIN